MNGGMRIPMDPPEPGRAFQFQGIDHGGADMAFFVNRTPPGRGPSVHKHAYHEAFVLLEGRMEVVLGDESFEAAGGEMVLVPPDTWHGFTNVGDEPLLMVSIHPVAEMATEWKEA
jgi:mannose-6-phosphate isomerase-like protein (cupin superfamily)